MAASINGQELAALIEKRIAANDYIRTRDDSLVGRRVVTRLGTLEGREGVLIGYGGLWSGQIQLKRDFTQRFGKLEVPYLKVKQRTPKGISCVNYVTSFRVELLPIGGTSATPAAPWR